MVEVNSQAYCRAFEAMGNISPSNSKSWSDSICSGLNVTGDMPSIEKGNSGDGIILAQNYDVIAGKRQTAVWRNLSQNAWVSNGYNQGGSVELKQDSLQDIMVDYFIAGAFGESELVGDQSLDSNLVSGLSKLYKLCLNNSNTCLSSDLASDVSKISNSFVSNYESLRIAKQKESDAIYKLQGEISNAWNTFCGEFSALSNKTVFLASIAGQPALTYAQNNGFMMDACQSVSFSRNTSLDDLKKIRSSIDYMISAVKQARKEEERTGLISNKGYYEEKAKELYAKIEDKGWSYRIFMRAAKAGLACMPSGSNDVEQACVSKNKYSMMNGLLSYSNNYPEKLGPCYKYERKVTGRECHVPYGPPSTPVYLRGAPVCKDTEEEDCVERGPSTGKDYTEEFLTSYAKGYCSTTCK